MELALSFYSPARGEVLSIGGENYVVADFNRQGRTIELIKGRKITLTSGNKEYIAEGIEAEFVPAEYPSPKNLGSLVLYKGDEKIAQVSLRSSDEGRELTYRLAVKELADYRIFVASADYESCEISFGRAEDAFKVTDNQT